MNWAAPHIEKLKGGKTVKFRPRGGSMSGRIESGQLVTVEPVMAETDLRPDHIVLCKVRGDVFLHLIKSGPRADGCFLIGNNRGRVNGWTGRQHIFGRVTAIED